MDDAPKSIMSIWKKTLVHELSIQMDLDYCLRCRKKTPTLEPTVVTLRRKDGRTQSRQVGKCAICGGRKSTLLPIGRQWTGGDIQGALSKLPGLPWAKFAGEKHLPGYAYCGPGTRLDKRLDSSGRPLPGLEPINRVDAACLNHDKAYSRSSDIRSRQKADVDLIQDLNEIRDPSIGERAGRAATKAGLKAKIAVGGRA